MATVTPLRGYCSHQGVILATKGGLWPLRGYLGQAQQPVHHPPHQHPSDHQLHHHRRMQGPRLKSKALWLWGAGWMSRNTEESPGMEQGWELASCSSRGQLHAEIALQYLLCVEELPSAPPDLGFVAESCT